VRAPSKGLSTRNVFFVLYPWSSAPVACSSIRPKSQIFNTEHDYALWNRNFMVKIKKPENLDFETWSNGPRNPAIIRPKCQNSNKRHDGILSIGNFMLMIYNHFALFQLPGNLLKTKKCAPYFRGHRQFPIYRIYFNNSNPIRN
jgi:hypothetical protein